MASVRVDPDAKVVAAREKVARLEILREQQERTTQWPLACRFRAIASKSEAVPAACDRVAKLQQALEVLGDISGAEWTGCERCMQMVVSCSGQEACGRFGRRTSHSSQKYGQATMTALMKFDGGIRGIATSTSFRRLVSKSLAR